MSKKSSQSNAPQQGGENKRVRFRHRLPVRLRHYWKTAAAVAAGFIAVALVFGAYTVRPFITSELVSEDTVTNNIEGTGDLFDGSNHTIEISFNESEYKDMMETFKDEGEKEFIHADMTIDGTLIENVGLRLKGNSTLMSLRGDSAMPGGKDGQMPDMPEGDEDGMPDMPAGGGTDEGGEPGGGMQMVQLSEDHPEELPWLVSFEEFEDGRAYQGRTEVALRPAANGSDTALNEALALSLTAESDQATQEFNFSSVSVNGSDSAARLVLDSPDTQWADALGNGVLYKGRASGSFDYVGEDPTDYEESFKQINAEGSYDLQPVMELLKFVNESDDDEFAEEIEDHLDVDSFAQYLATQELLSNWDAMDGAGNNFYLWYDTDSEKFEVLSWDLNMALSNMGGMPGGGQNDDQDQGQKSEGAEVGDGKMPDMPEGGQGMPEGGPGGSQGDGDSSQSRGSGVLKERFLDNDEFYQLYEDAYADLYSELIDNGYATKTLSTLAEQAEASGDEETQTAVASIKEKLSTISAEAPEPSSGMFGGR